MIFPDRLTDPKNCLIYYTFLVLKHLKKYKSIKYNTLEHYLSNTIQNYSQTLFINSLDCLFLMGKIDYNVENDVLEALYEVK